MNTFKNILAFLLFISVLFVAVPGKADAAAAADEVIRLSDGGYIVVSTEDSGSAGMRGTKTGSKTYSDYDSSGNLRWTAKLTGSFTYNGTVSTCTSAGCTVTISNSAYYVISRSAYASGNTAYADVTIGCRVLGVTISSESYSITLTCDANGNLS